MTLVRAPLAMLVLSFALAFALSSAVSWPAQAEACGALIDRLAAATKTTVIGRGEDHAGFSAEDGMTVTLACGEPSAVGVHARGTAPGPGYFVLFGRAGELVTGVAAASIAAAGERAQAQAVTTRHSHADAGRALVTCSVAMSDAMSGPTSGTRSGAGSVTACAVTESDDRR